MKILRVGLAFSVLGVLIFFAGCAEGSGPPQLSQMDFLALVNGQDASVVHLDSQGHATDEPIDFLKGQPLLGLEAAGLDNVVTLEKHLVNNSRFVGDFFLKYYHHKVLAKTFTIPSEASVNWMLLLPDKNCLLVQTETPGPTTPYKTFKFDLTTGEGKAVAFTSKTTGQMYHGDTGRPIWDASRGSLIAVVTRERPEEPGKSNPNNDFLRAMDPLKFLGRVDPSDLSLTDETPLNARPDRLLDYDPVANSVKFYGIAFGLPALFDINSDARGFFERSWDTGKQKLLITDMGRWLPDSPMSDMGLKPANALAIVNRRYVIMTRTHTIQAASSNLANHYSHQSYLVDLQNHGWKALGDIPFVTWPVSQAGLHLDDSQK